MRLEVAGIIVDRAQQATELIGSEDGGIVLGLGRRQRAVAQAGRVASAARGRHAIAEHPAGKGTAFLGRLVLALVAKPSTSNGSIAPSGRLPMAGAS